MMTEFRIYELTRESSRLFGYYWAGDADFPAKENWDNQLSVQDMQRGYNGMRIVLRRPPDYEELLVMASGWMPWQVNLLTVDGMNLSRGFVPLSLFTLYPTDIETGFARFSTAGMEGPLTTYMLTARRAQ
jgi:hypothetical protein